MSLSEPTGLDWSTGCPTRIMLPFQINNRYLGTHYRLGWIGESPPSENPPDGLLELLASEPDPKRYYLFHSCGF
jgi:hypothetical protein